MRLESKRRPRNYLGRGEQWRLLLLVFALGAVVLLMAEARNPGNWAWMFGPAKGERNGDADRPPPSQIDNRLPAPAPDELPPDAVMIEPPGEPRPPEAETGELGGYFPGVHPKLFDEMRDDRLTRREEWPAWINLLDVLQHADEADLEKASLDRVAYSQLFDQSSVYRGRLVTVRGTVRGVFRYPLLIAPPDSQLEAYYQVWLYPKDNPAAPIMAYCLHLPEGFPTGTELSEEASIRGFFLKRTAYKAQDGFRTAPTILARTLRWTRAPVAEKRAMPAPWQWAVLIGGSVLFGVLVALVVYQRTRRDRPTLAAAAPAQRPPEFDALP